MAKKTKGETLLREIKKVYTDFASGKTVPEEGPYAGHTGYIAHDGSIQKFVLRRGVVYSETWNPVTNKRLSSVRITK